MKKIFYIVIVILLGFTACVEDKVYEGPASISNVTYLPEAPTPDDAVSVSATISDLQGIVTAEIKYKVNNGSEQSVSMSGSGTTYTGSIPKQLDESVVEFYIWANNVAAIPAISSVLSYTVGAIPIDYSGLVLNELNGNNKFIELFNKGTESIDISGVYLKKDNDPIVWTAPAGLKIAAGEYILLYSEDVIANYPDHNTDLVFASGLSAKKNVRIQMFSPKNTSIDDFNLTGYTTVAPASYSRFPNGTGPWVFADATPKAENTTGGDLVPGLE